MNGSLLLYTKKLKVHKNTVSIENCRMYNQHQFDLVVFHWQIFTFRFTRYVILRLHTKVFFCELKSKWIQIEMRSTVACFALLTVSLWLNVFHAPHVAAFFDYNKFHPLPYRPDLQEFCPQVRHEQSSNLLYIRTQLYYTHTQMNWRNKMNKRNIHIFKYNFQFALCSQQQHFFFTWTLPFSVFIFRWKRCEISM